MTQLGASVDAAVQGLLVLCLVLAAVEDGWRYRISNKLSLSIVALFAVAAALAGFRIDWVDHLAGAALVFAVGLPMFARGWLGGGDVKLLTAVALWCGIGGLPLLLVVTSLVGGLLVIMLFALRRLPVSAKGSAPPGGRRDGPVPYGIAICIGALLVLWPAPLEPTRAPSSANAAVANGTC